MIQYENINKAAIPVCNEAIYVFLKTYLINISHLYECRYKCFYVQYNAL